MLGILDLVSVERPVLHAADVVERLGYTRATGYRYLKALCDAGLLALAGGGIYTLGPRVLELDRLHGLTDPLLRAGHDITAEFAEMEPRSSFLVCSLYRDRVLCIHQDGVARHSANGRIIPLQRVRGLPMPLFSGAASLAILASLPLHRIKSLYLDKHQEIAAAGLGESWRAFRAGIAAIRKRGYACTRGQMSSELVAVAAPIRTNEGYVLGSLTRIMLRTDFDAGVEADIAARIVAAAWRIEARLADEVAGTAGQEEAALLIAPARPKA
jgi:DNA-binding IclR family transcriptional regulator